MSDVADLSAPPQPDDQKRILFRFSHATAETLSVPAALLIQTLEGAQRVIWLLALAAENRDIRMRARIPVEIEQRYQYKMQPAASGQLYHAGRGCIRTAFADGFRPDSASHGPV